jgi:hypothetical protein
MKTGVSWARSSEDFCWMKQRGCAHNVGADRDQHCPKLRSAGEHKWCSFGNCCAVLMRQTLERFERDLPASLSAFRDGLCARATRVFRRMKIDQSAPLSAPVKIDRPPLHAHRETTSQLRYQRGLASSLSEHAAHEAARTRAQRRDSSRQRGLSEGRSQLESRRILRRHRDGNSGHLHVHCPMNRFRAQLCRTHMRSGRTTS